MSCMSSLTALSRAVTNSLNNVPGAGDGALGTIGPIGGALGAIGGALGTIGGALGAASYWDRLVVALVSVLAGGELLALESGGFH